MSTVAERTLRLGDRVVVPEPDHPSEPCRTVWWPVRRNGLQTGSCSSTAARRRFFRTLAKSLLRYMQRPRPTIQWAWAERAARRPNAAPGLDEVRPVGEAPSQGGEAPWPGQRQVADVLTPSGCGPYRCGAGGPRTARRPLQKRAARIGRRRAVPNRTISLNSRGSRPNSKLSTKAGAVQGVPGVPGARWLGRVRSGRRLRCGSRGNIAWRWLVPRSRAPAFTPGIAVCASGCRVVAITSPGVAGYGAAGGGSRIGGGVRRRTGNNPCQE